MMAKRRCHVPRWLRDEVDRLRKSGPPRGAILADLSQQAPNNSYGPPLYYRDFEFTCVDCGQPQVWTASQQKWWYEVAKGPIFSIAKRCRSCRAARRASHGGTPRRSHADRNRGDG
jgi:hypothetical protein